MENHRTDSIPNDSYPVKSDRLLDDLKLAIGLLTGYQDWTDGLPKKQYLKKEQEFVARKAIGRLLRARAPNGKLKPFDTALRYQLAALFDPETETAPFSSFDSAPMERRLEFAPRHRGGGRQQALRKVQLAIAFDELCRQPGKSRDDALHEIAERFSVTTRTVETAAAHLIQILEKSRGSRPVKA
jgi:hypothetical protein